MRDISFDDMMETIPINEPRLPCVILIDTSKSMSKHIDKLNSAIMQFKDSVCNNEISRSRIDLCIVEYNTEVGVVQDFVPIKDLPTVKLKAGGRTLMGTAINKAIDLVKERCWLYQRIGTPCYKPWIFMITDGSPWGESKFEIERARQRIEEEESKGSVGKLKFFAVAVDNADKELLSTLTKRVIELKDADFGSLFNWLGDSMVAISVSTPDNEAKLKALPSNAMRYNSRDEY